MSGSSLPDGVYTVVPTPFFNPDRKTSLT